MDTPRPSPRTDQTPDRLRSRIWRPSTTFLSSACHAVATPSLWSSMLDRVDVDFTTEDFFCAPARSPNTRAHHPCGNRSAPPPFPLQEALCRRWLHALLPLERLLFRPWLQQAGANPGKAISPSGALLIPGTACHVTTADGSVPVIGSSVRHVGPGAPGTGQGARTSASLGACSGPAAARRSSCSTLPPA